MGKHSSDDDRDCSTRENCYRCPQWVPEHKACGGCYVIVEPQHVNAQICKDIETALLKLDTLNIDYDKMDEIKMDNCTRFIMAQWDNGVMEFGDNEFEVCIQADETKELLSDIVSKSYYFYGTSEDCCEHVDFSLIIDKIITPKVINRIKKAAIEEQTMVARFKNDNLSSINPNPFALRPENMPKPKIAK